MFTVSEIIDGVDRLDELVQITAHGVDINKGDKVLRIDETGIHAQIDWFDKEPPYLFPVVELTKENLLALVHYKLDNQQRAFRYLKENDVLYPHMLVATQLKFGYEIDAGALKVAAPKGHNRAIVQHYGNMAPRPTLKDLRQLYTTALEHAKDKETKSYTAKHYINLLLDAHLFGAAIMASEAFLPNAESKEAEMALKMQWCSARFKNLQVPYHTEELEKIQAEQENCILYLEENDLSLNTALLAIEACDIANFLGDYPKAKAHINKAIKVFKEEEVSDFLGEAGLKKAHLLYNWSKNGSPQYYKASINAFQDVLKVFKRDTHPDYFAEIHHYLALIYSEIPAPPEEKPIWMAFSASSFKEALDFYGKETHPYEHAMVCHNYATALMDFPPAKLHNNHDRANELFEDALSIRTPEKYPTERALTILNQLELGWLMHNDGKKEEKARSQEMKAKATEVFSLVKDENLLARAKEQLNKLERLNTII